MKMTSGLFLMCTIFCGLMVIPVSGVMVKIKNYGMREKRDTEKEPDHEKFMIPKTLKLGDEIKVTGNMTADRRRIIVSLVMHSELSNSPDFDNVACQVRATFPSEFDAEDNVTIHAVVNGEHQEPLPADFAATDVFTVTDFTIHFIITGEEDKINIDLNLNDSASAAKCELQHDLKDIKYLTLGGHIHKVDEIYFLLA